ncbi:hypothetical protein VM1G_10068 [Cytospora mali]|uniref:AB hydrolase-1 domain-containing protein n=1 Tax=Cytospora mali TaxID=578113 RepID=A0A194WDV8_CYTMA|nr:hypothetical protein VM1G_10068 [Valsa mali]
MASNTSGTTFVLVPGAWHSTSAFKPMAELLKAAGYNVQTIDLASCGSEPPVEDLQPDVHLISSAVEEAADKGQNVVVFMHSYGGIVGTESCRGLGKKEREASGKKGGVVELIYCCAFMVEEGVSIMDMLGNQPLPWFVVSDDGARLSPSTPETIFYNDLSHEEAQRYTRTLRHHSYHCLKAKLTYPAYKYIHTTYLYCTKDNAIILPVQEKMVEDTRKMGAYVDTVTLEASHSPYLSMPDQVVAACCMAIGDSL